VKPERRIHLSQDIHISESIFRETATDVAKSD
jgi:hypothetical protein